MDRPWQAALPVLTISPQGEPAAGETDDFRQTTRRLLHERSRTLLVNLAGATHIDRLSSSVHAPRLERAGGMTVGGLRLAPILLSGVSLLAAEGTGAVSAAKQADAATSPAVVAAQASAATRDEGEGRVRFRFDDHPQLRVGQAVRVDFRLKLQGDLRAFSPEPSVDPDDEALSLARVGVEGRVTKYLEFEADWELTDQDEPWRNARLNAVPIEACQLQVGRFKVPFSRERLMGPASLEFTQRAIGVRLIAPGYDTGVMLHGRLRRRVLTYAVGVFRGRAEETPELADPPGVPPAQDHDERLWAWRVTTRPFARAAGPAWAAGLEIGVNGTRSEIDEGRFGWSADATFGGEFFDQLYVNGRRTRLGADVALVAGPASAQFEWLRGRDERRRQGMEVDDLPALEARDWYAWGTVVLTGETKRQVERPRRPLLRGGIGSVEAAVRVEHLTLGSQSNGGEGPSLNPRGVNVLRNGDAIWTLGLNWYPTRFVKVQFDAIRERFDDQDRTPLDAHDTFWSYVLRLQFVL